jgi:membrane fusion protein (multidrug efflux system)
MGSSSLRAKTLRHCRTVSHCLLRQPVAPGHRLSAFMLRSVVAIALLLTLTAGGGFGCKKAGPAAGAPAAFPPTQVVVMEARQQPVAESLSLVGSLVANEIVELKSETEGVIQEINFEEGKKVDKGQLLFKLDDTKLNAAVAEAEASFKLSQANFERSQQLANGKIISPQELDQAASTFELNRASLELKKRQLKDTRIHAPFPGVIGARFVSPGQVIVKETRLATLVEYDPVKVEFSVPERFVGQLRVGQFIEIKLAAFGEERFKGEVFFIAPQVDPASRTAFIKARISNPKLQLKPGMFANLELTLKIREAAIIIPEAAVMLSGDKASVYVVDKAQNAQIRPVKLGMRLAGWVEVLTGVEQGEPVIIEGLQKTRPAGPVKAVPPSADSPYAARAIIAPATAN